METKKRVKAEKKVKVEKKVKAIEKVSNTTNNAMQVSVACVDSKGVFFKSPLQGIVAIDALLAFASDNKVSKSNLRYVEIVAKLASKLGLGVIAKPAYGSFAISICPIGAKVYSPVICFHNDSSGSNVVINKPYLHYGLGYSYDLQSDDVNIVIKLQARGFYRLTCSTSYVDAVVDLLAGLFKQ